MPLTEQQNAELNDEIEAWNNISAFIKFIVLEDYITTKTANDIAQSLNALTPKHVENNTKEKEQTEEEVYEDAPKEQAGFITQQVQLLREIRNELLDVVSESLYETHLLTKDMESLRCGFDDILNKYINTEIK